MRTSIKSLCNVVFGMFLLCAFGLMAGRASAEVTLRSLLEEMVDFDRLASWPSPAFTLRQASSHDRSEVAPDQPGWFGNRDFSNFLRVEQNEGRAEHVMLDADGPGAIVRFWITSPDPRRGRIRLYLDGATRPTVEWPSYDLYSWRVKVPSALLGRHPNIDHHGGSTLYLPIPYAQHCKVTFEFANPNEAGGVYFQINYRTYVASTQVTTFQLDQVNAERDTIERVSQVLETPPQRTGTDRVQADEALNAGGSTSIDLPNGAYAIRQLELSIGADLPPAAREQALRQVILSATFDDEVEAIWCPMGDFAGSGAGGYPLMSWYRSADGKGTSVCRWTMPYRRRAKLTLHNLGNLGVRVAMKAEVSPWQWDDRSMYFRTTWHRTANIRSDPPNDFNYLNATGRGVLVGDVTSVFNPLASWYGEGDERIRVDGGSFTEYLGTGLEDYYNASWAPNPVFQSPFANQPRIDQPQSQGNNCYTRSRNLDGVPFAKSLEFGFEIQTWKPSLLDWSGTTYWYGFTGARADRVASPHEATIPIAALPPARVIEGAIEAEALRIVSRSKDLSCEVQQLDFADGFWSHGAHLLIKGGQAGDYVELEVPAQQAGPQRIVVFATKARDYGMVRFSVNGRPAGEDFDGFNPNVSPSGPIALGVFEPKDGKFTLRAELVAANSRADGARFYAGIDAIRLGR